MQIISKGNKSSKSLITSINGFFPFNISNRETHARVLEFLKLEISYKINVIQQ